MKTNIATAERAELKAQLKALRLDAKIVGQDLKTIDTNERKALAHLRKDEREIKRYLRNLDKRRKSLAREIGAERKGTLKRAGAIARRISIVKGRLS